MMDEKTYFGLSKAEYDNLMLAVRYGVIIVLTVLITFTVVAGVSRLFGYTPPPPSSSQPTPESTLEATLVGE